jgi:hypothetical protein
LRFIGRKVLWQFIKEIKVNGVWNRNETVEEHNYIQVHRR